MPCNAIYNLVPLPRGGESASVETVGFCYVFDCLELPGLLPVLSKVKVATWNPYTAAQLTLQYSGMATVLATHVPQVFSSDHAVEIYCWVASQHEQEDTLFEYLLPVSISPACSYSSGRGWRYSTCHSPFRGSLGCGIDLHRVIKGWSQYQRKAKVFGSSGSSLGVRYECIYPTVSPSPKCYL